VTHDHRLEAFADRVIHIDDGRIMDDVRLNQAATAPTAPPARPALQGA
jgi:putative ABC transport system ATP-binding protein